jgi:DNA-binding IclR family transcriptional regulator
VFTPRTLRTQEQLTQALQQIRQCGFAINEEEDSLGLNALAVPIRDPRGRVVAGLAVHAPLARMDLATMVGKRERLEHCAADIARNWFGPQ